MSHPVFTGILLRRLHCTNTHHFSLNYICIQTFSLSLFLSLHMKTPSSQASHFLGLITHTHTSMCATWPIHEPERGARDSTYVALSTLIHICDMTHTLQICDMTPSSVRHDSFICATWLIHEPEQGARDSTYVALSTLIHICDMSHTLQICDMTHSRTGAHTAGRGVWLEICAHYRVALVSRIN